MPLTPTAAEPPVRWDNASTIAHREPGGAVPKTLTEVMHAQERILKESSGVFESSVVFLQAVDDSSMNLNILLAQNGTLVHVCRDGHCSLSCRVVAVAKMNEA